MKKRRKIRAWIALAATVLLSACFPPSNPFANEFTTSRPNNNDVLGVYELTYQSVSGYAPGLESELRALQKKPRILLNETGAFVFENVPNFQYEPDVFHLKYHGLLSKSGTWEVFSVGGVGDGTGKIETHWGLRLTGLDRPTREVNPLSFPGFMGKPKPDRLVMTFFDGDQGTVMIFKRVTAR